MSDQLHSKLTPHHCKNTCTAFPRYINLILLYILLQVPEIPLVRELCEFLLPIITHVAGNSLSHAKNYKHFMEITSNSTATNHEISDRKTLEITFTLRKIQTIHKCNNGTTPALY